MPIIEKLDIVSVYTNDILLLTDSDSSRSDIQAALYGIVSKIKQDSYDHGYSEGFEDGSNHK